jgi:hypothetical protein
MTAQQDNPYLTITLTDRAPVKIKKDEWPLLAEATKENYDGEYESQANWKSKWALRVRTHQDGRAIVYGVYSYSSNWMNARDFAVRGGELLTTSTDLPAAIRRIGEWMAGQEQNEGDAARWESLINQCIADLPAQEL